jgi:uncharacterized repeat protein (TIGR01451 family)
MPRGYSRLLAHPKSGAWRLRAIARGAAAIALLLTAAAGPALGGPISGADLSIEKTDFPDPVTAGQQLTYTIIASNLGPEAAEFASWSDTLPAGVTFLSLSSSGAWTCTTPAVGSGGDVDCSIDSFPVGSELFTLVVTVDPGVTDGTVLSNTATVGSETPDPSESPPSSSTATTLVTDTADLGVTKTDDPDPVDPGAALTYVITVTNDGPSDAGPLTLDDTLPAGVTFQSLASPGGWSCSTPAVGDPGAISCDVASFAPGGTAVFTLVVEVDAGATPGSFIDNVATASSEVFDPNPDNDTGHAVTLVAGGPDYSILKSDSPDPVLPGGDLTYTITATNAGDLPLANVEVSDELPLDATFVSLAEPAGWTCTTPGPGPGGTVSCTIASMPSGDAVFTLVVAVRADAAPGSLLVNSALIVSSTPELDPEDNSAAAVTAVAAPPAPELSVSKTVSGDFSPGGAVTYSLVLTNAGPGDQPDNPGDELTDVLPAELTLVSAAATSGTAVSDVPANTVHWNGPLAAGASVTLTIQATLEATATPGATVVNQATFAFDADTDGSNEAAGVSDDPGEPGAADPTSFVVAGGPTIAEIPTLAGWGALALAHLLALGGSAWLRRG